MARAAEATHAIGRDFHAPALERQHVIAVEHHLRDPLAMRDLEWLLGNVSHDDTPLVREVGVDGARRIRNRKPFLEHRAASRADLCLVTVRQARLEAKGNERHRTGRQHDDRIAARRGYLPLPLPVGAIDRSTFDIGEEIVPGRALRRSSRRLCVFVQELDHDRIALQSDVGDGAVCLLSSYFIVVHLIRVG